MRSNATHFNSHIAGIPCIVEVINYSPGDDGQRPRHNPRTADLIDPGEPPNPPEFEYNILDRTGHPATWLERKITAEDHPRLLNEWEEIVAASRREAEENQL